MKENISNGRLSLVVWICKFVLLKLEEENKNGMISVYSEYFLKLKDYLENLDILQNVEITLVLWYKEHPCTFPCLDIFVVVIALFLVPP